MQIPNLCVGAANDFDAQMLLQPLLSAYTRSCLCGQQLVRQVHDEGVDPIAERIKSTLLLLCCLLLSLRLPDHACCVNRPILVTLLGAGIKRE